MTTPKREVESEQRPLGRVLRGAALGCLALVAAVAGPVPVVAADDGGDAKPAAATDRCARGNACYHFLRAPVSAPDPCFCPLCTDEHRHAGDALPDGWNRACADRRGLPCFLKRHAASWHLTCSACLADTDCCKEPFPARCPMCGDDRGAGPWRKDAEKIVAERLAVERRHWDKAEPVVVVGSHFYVVTDVRSVKVITPHDGERVLSGHEYAHVLVMRAEQARRDFEAAFGMPGTPGQVGLFVPERDTTGRKIRNDYFRNPNVPFVYSAYGSASESAISEGFCMNGACIPLQRVGDDAGMHEALRQFVAQIFFTTWVVASGELKCTPPWAFAGIGLWVGKSPAALANEVYWLEGEDNTVSASGKNWRREVTDTAKKRGFRPIEEILAATTLSKLTAADYRQVWAWFDVAMADIPKEWAALLADLRRGTEVHAAFKHALGWTPDEFQLRFEDRLAGVRRTLADGPAVAETAKPPAAETDPEKLAARIRSVGVPKDTKSVRELLDVCGRDGDLVRETAVLVLSRIRDAEPREPLWRYGVVHADPKVRATALRLVRLLRVTEARAAVRVALADPSWFVRAEALLAAAAIRDFDAQAAMRDALGGGEAKLRIAAADALRALGKDANPLCVAPLVGCLDHEAWQVRVAAADALAVVGTIDAVDALVRNLDKETARVVDAYRDALVQITGEDLGVKPANWVAWWGRERPLAASRGGFLPPTKKPKSDGRYAEEPPPTYYGVELWTARVGFVLDVSRSTNRNFAPPSGLAPRLLGGLPSVTIQVACQNEIAATLRSLDARTQVALWSFSTDVASWNPRMVPANRANVDSAIGFVRSRSPAGETNFHGALRAATGLAEADPWSSRLPTGPDTVTFLTDGSPTAGEITEPEVLLQWAVEANRYPRVRLHTIAMGALGVDEPLLQRLASRNGGEFRQIREEDPK